MTMPSAHETKQNAINVANVMIPNGDEFAEQPIPEQFKTVINGIKLSTTMTEST